MTYLTSRAEHETNWVGNGGSLIQEGEAEESMPAMEEAVEFADPEPLDPDSSAVGSVNGNNASGKQNGAM